MTDISLRLMPVIRVHLHDELLEKLNLVYSNLILKVFKNYFN
ncbi:MAG: hypothetical protein AAF849_14585 [Bacteroidota bacterium]